MKKVWLGICERIQKTESDETVFKGGRVFKGGGALLLSGSVRKLQAGSQETTKEASHNKSRCVCACHKKTRCVCVCMRVFVCVLLYVNSHKDRSAKHP